MLAVCHAPALSAVTVVTRSPSFPEPIVLLPYSSILAKELVVPDNLNRSKLVIPSSAEKPVSGLRETITGASGGSVSIVNGKDKSAGALPARSVLERSRVWAPSALPPKSTVKDHRPFPSTITSPTFVPSRTTPTNAPASPVPDNLAGALPANSAVPFRIRPVNSESRTRFLGALVSILTSKETVSDLFPATSRDVALKRCLPSTNAASSLGQLRAQSPEESTSVSPTTVPSFAPSRSTPTSTLVPISPLPLRAGLVSWVTRSSAEKPVSLDIPLNSGFVGLVLSIVTTKGTEEFPICPSASVIRATNSTLPW